MALVLPHSNVERETLLSEALFAAQSRITRDLEAARAQMTAANAQLNSLKAQQAKSKRWLSRAFVDADNHYRAMQKKVASLEKQLSTQTIRQGLENTEQRYAKAMAETSKLQANRLVSSSIHSAAKTFRRNNVVLMAPENADECIRQHMRAEMGLQDTPLMLTAGDVCDDCGVQMTVVANDSMLSCTLCHKLRLLPNMMTTSALHGTDVETSATITKHRLPEWIEMAQGKELMMPPRDVILEVAKFLVAHNMTGLEQYAEIIAAERAQGGPFRGVSDAETRLSTQIPDLGARLRAVSSSCVRTALRGIVTEGSKAKSTDKFRKFYERSSKICALVTGFWPPRMTGAQEELLRRLYTIAAPEYEKRRKPRQTYWPGGFPFFLRCLCVLLGWDEFAVQFPIPSGSREGGTRDTLRAEIWHALGWEQVPYSGQLPPITLPDGSSWSLILDDDDTAAATSNDTAAAGSADATDAAAVGEAKRIRKEVEGKLSIKKRRRVDFELECS